MQFNNVVNGLSRYYSENSAEFNRTNRVEQYEACAGDLGGVAALETKFKIKHADQSPDSFTLQAIQFCFDRNEVSVEDAINLLKQDPGCKNVQSFKNTADAVKYSGLDDTYTKHIIAIEAMIIFITECDPGITVFADPDLKAVGLIYKKHDVITAFQIKE